MLQVGIVLARKATRSNAQQHVVVVGEHDDEASRAKSPSVCAVACDHWEKFQCPIRNLHWWWHRATGVWFLVDDLEWGRYINPNDNEPWLWHRKSGWWFWERIGRGGHRRCEENVLRENVERC